MTSFSIFIKLLPPLNRLLFDYEPLPLASPPLIRCCIEGICWLFSVEDIERNDGSPEKPYYMSDSLKKILNKQNRGSVERVDGASDTEKPKSDE